MGEGGARAWLPAATGAWAACHAVMQITWATTGAVVPWSPHVAYHPAVHLALAAVAVAAGAAAVATTRVRSKAVLAVAAAAAAVFATGMLSLPAHVVTLLSFSGVESGAGLTQVLSSTVGVCLLVGVATRYRRRLRGRCPRCGATHPAEHTGPLVYPPPSVASARTRLLVGVLVCGVVPWAAVKTVWTLGGDALGVTAEAWRAGSAGESGVLAALGSVGVDVTVLAAAAALVLVAGLTFRWGQVFPRWAFPVAGRRVPRLLPLLPAWLTAVGLSVYGPLLVAYAALSALGVLPAIAPAEPFPTSADTTWMVAFGGLAFGGLGSGLLVAAGSYGKRTRPTCSDQLR
ncbi:hypothetical protein [Actinokineospora sp. UTMC 2448]|uniref:hypothetical protein n=1 Tax=Actinokineospora sp. UTMC 2448 TaxID=2268449 RepID=UPI0021641061|nr:hypothetical protein [Actinokineospora sp. UTMC 2448]UVS76806.1 hypothetical protein Actkin_00501 [Actinokineospora sp. UTMC 2448]